ncbi:MAG: leucine-rich repeat domain-containing protein [Ruminococcus sp.]
MKLKKLMSILLASLIIMSSLSVINAFAVTDTAVSSGMTLGEPTVPDPDEVTSGDYIYLPLTEDTAMLVEYLGNDTKITTPATIDGYKIVSIGDGAFICKDKITDVVISEGVTSIGEYAFYACHSLASVTFPETLVSIGRRAFRADLQLTSVNIPDSVEEIQSGAFANTPKLADVKIGTGIKTIGDNAFNQTDILTISGYVNTVACEYAYKNGIKFNSLGVAPVQPTPTVEKKANPVKVTVKNTTVSAKKLESKKQTVKPITVKDAKGTVEVVKVKSGTTSKIYKKITVNKKTGAITFSKGKYSKKTYNIKLKITAKGNSEYKSKVITKTVKVKVK